MGISGPFFGMVLAVTAQANDMVVSKAAMSEGLSRNVLLVYSSALSTLILLPISIYVHRSDIPPLNFSIILDLFLFALTGCTALICSYAGIQYSSPTMGTAMLSLAPAFTFILALIFRMEKLDLRRSSGIAKSIGTIVSIGGAFIITLYKGSPIVIIRPISNLNDHRILFSSQSNWILGGFLSAGHALLASLWYIFQASILKKCPAVLIVVLFYCFFLTIQSAIVCLIVEKDFSVWRLSHDIGLIAIVYSAVIGTVFRVGLTVLCMKMTGPLFVSMFKPLGIVAAAVMGIIFLGDALYLGSVIGALVIAAGFYAVMWGKYKEEFERECMDSSTQETPLLQNKIEEMNSKGVV